jgi:DNA recombination protein RmuC
MEILVLITIGILSAALGLVLGRYVWPAHRGIDPAVFASSQTEVARLNQECEMLRTRADQLTSECRAAADQAKIAGEEVARLTERASSLATQLQEQTSQTSTLQTQRDSAVSELSEAASESARLTERVSSLTKQLEEQTRQISTLQTQRDTAITEAKNAASESARLTERVSSLTGQLEDQTSQISTLQTQRDSAMNEAKAAASEIARLTERESALTQQLATQADQFAELQKQLTTEFENIANRVLKASASELSESSHETLEAILKPLRERIQEFQNKVETTYQAENREVLSLKEQIKLILDTSSTIGGHADSLAKALRGDSQLLGRWGELALERILEAAGLTEGREYISQGRGLGLKSESGGVQKPDIVIMLPEQRTMIIDSKVPLASYERLIEAKEEEARSTFADQFVKDMKGHIDALASKRYQDNVKLQAHDCVLMFVPIEGALAAALTREPELFVYGWDRRVVLIGPPTLLMTMRTVASIWRYEDQAKNAQDIARLAGDLCDKVSMSLVDLNGVTEKITEALSTHNEAVKRLSTGKGNAISIGERIRGLGVKTKRAMPPMLVDGVPVMATAEGFDEDAQPAADGN